MEDKKEKYVSVIKKVYQAFCPKDTSLSVKIILAFLALLVSFLVMLLKHIIADALWK